jgi:hypothetical protein
MHAASMHMNEWVLTERAVLGLLSQPQAPTVVWLHAYERHRPSNGRDQQRRLG